MASAPALIVVEEPQEAAERAARARDAAAGIVARLEGLAREAVSARSVIEKRWIEDTRAYLGQYDEATLRNISDSAHRSQSFINITQPKTDTMKAKLVDLLFPVDEKNWGINPTPVPELSAEARRAMEQAQQAADEANRLQDLNGGAATVQSAGLLASAAELGARGAELTATLDEAAERAERMERQIDDQLTESDYPKRCRDAIEWACKLGPGIIKGPLVRSKTRSGWQQGDGGAWALEQVDDPTIEYAVVNPWDFFPDPSATSMEDCEHVLQRHLPTPTMLKRMARRLKFDLAAVRDLVTEGAKPGGTSDLNHIAEIRSLTGEMQAVSGRFVLWEYHGPLEIGEIATLIRASGDEAAEVAAAAYEAEADPLDTRMVIAWFCEGRLLKLVKHFPMDSGEHLYNVFSLHRGEASILGAYGMPRILYHPQRALNAAWRMMLDNAKLSVGPQVLIDKGALQPQDGSWDLVPFKAWLWDSMKGNGQAPFAIFNIPINQTELANIITLALQFSDDVSMLPRVLQGADSGQGALITQTANGMAMLFNAANLAIRDIVKNWDDDLTVGVVRRAYDWNMQFGTDEALKGDMQIEARGTSVLLVREMQATNLLGLAERWSTHPVLGVALKVYQAQRMALQALNLNPDAILEPEDVFKKRIEQMQNAGNEGGGEEAMRLQIAQIESETRLRVAEIARDTALMELAEKLNMKADDLAAKLNVERERSAATVERERVRAASSERRMAAEFAGERELERERRATGAAPGGSGGTFA